MTKPYQPSIGSISSGKLHTVDLLEAFADELERIEAGNPLVTEARAVLTLVKAGWDMVADGEEASELVSALQDELQQHAPDYCYFGTSEGDGADFGFWPSMESINELPRVDDPADVENHLGEACAFVNDHGNVTVYGSDGKILLELV
jgi:hypothetical protein